MDAVKLLWQLWDREDCSGSLRSSSILLTLLVAVQFTVRLQWVLDMSLAASYYAREGAMLAKRLFLRELEIKSILLWE